MTTFLLTPLVASAATLSALTWCRGVFPILATAFGSAAAFVIARSLA